jgi:hypothetical protein
MIEFPRILGPDGQQIAVATLETRSPRPLRCVRLIIGDESAEYESRDQPKVHEENGDRFGSRCARSLQKACAVTAPMAVNTPSMPAPSQTQ